MSDAPRSGYKRTEIGEIPEEWDIVRVRRILKLEYGSGLTESERRLGDFPVYGSKGMVGQHREALVNGPGIVVGRKGSVGAVSYVESDFWPIDTTYYVVLNEGFRISWRWLYYKLTSLKLERLKSVTGVPGLNRDDVYAIKVTLPPFVEQRKIADILSTVDDAIQNVDAIISKLQELKRGLMQRLLTRGIGHTRFKKTEIGEIPEEWEIARISEICHVTGGSTPSKKIAEYWGGSIPFVTPTDLTMLNGRNYLERTETSITEEGLRSCSSRLLPPGAVLLTSRATIGVCAINRVPVVTNQGFANVVCGERVYNLYLVYLLVCA